MIPTAAVPVITEFPACALCGIPYGLTLGLNPAAKLAFDDPDPTREDGPVFTWQWIRLCYHHTAPAQTVIS